MQRPTMANLLCSALLCSAWLALVASCSSEETTGGPVTPTPTGATGGAAGNGAEGGSTTITGGHGTGGSGVGGLGAAGAGAAGGGSGGGSASTGCGVQSPTGVIDATIDVAGTSRTYVLSVPAGYDPDHATALVFAWHGLGGSGQIARAYFGIEGQSGGEAIFVYPDGLVVQPQNDTGWELEPNGRDVALFDALYAELTAEYCIDEGRVFATGHSFGGYMSNALGCARSNLLRAIAPVAGGGPFGATCDSAPLSAWLAHGTNDPVVAFAQGVASRDHWLAHAGCGSDTTPTTPSECVEYQGCTSGRVVWCTHEEAHAWPTFAAGGIWAFFASFP